MRNVLKILTVIILLHIGLSSSYAQLQDSLRTQKLELLSNINASLSNSWTISIKLNDSTEESYKANAIKSYLFTYKTRSNGRNSGVIMNLYDISFKDSVEFHKKPTHSSIAVQFFYTKSFIVYVNHGKNVNEVYDGYMPKLMEELQLFFEENNEML